MTGIKAPWAWVVEMTQQVMVLAAKFDYLNS